MLDIWAFENHFQAKKVSWILPNTRCAVWSLQRHRPSINHCTLELPLLLMWWQFTHKWDVPNYCTPCYENCLDIDIDTNIVFPSKWDPSNYCTPCPGNCFDIDGVAKSCWYSKCVHKPFWGKTAPQFDLNVIESRFLWLLKPWNFENNFLARDWVSAYLGKYISYYL